MVPGSYHNFFKAVVFAIPLFAAVPARAGQECNNPAAALGVSRIVQIDATSGPIYGSMTRQAREPSFLRPNEVVLTFDDGPMPWVTRSILDTLDTYCTKATFFSVGRMALAYPATVRDVQARGHTVGTHTYSHPFNMPRMKVDTATADIERGVAAVATAAGGQIAPFFRFTGLSDSSRLLAYLQTRGIATFTVDVVSNDSYISDPSALADRTIAEINRNKGGIVLFHDIKRATAKALPAILERLKAQGYTVVHLTAKAHAVPLAEMMREVAPKLAQARNGELGGKTLLPFYGAIGPDGSAPVDQRDVTSLAPPARTRDVVPLDVSPRKVRRAANPAPSQVPSAGWIKSSIHDVTAQPAVVELDAHISTLGGWVTHVAPGHAPRPAKPAR